MYSPSTGSELEGLGRAAAEQPDVVEVGVAVDDEVLVDAHLVVAGARLVERGAAQGAGKCRSRISRGRAWASGGIQRVARVGILGGTTAGPDPEPAVVGRGAPASRCSPARRSSACAGARSACRPAAPRSRTRGPIGVAQAPSHQPREHLGEPGPAGEEDDARGQGVAAVERHGLERRAVAGAWRRAADPHVAAFFLEDPRHRLHRPPRADDAGRRLVQGEAEVVEADPRPAVRHLVRRQHLVGHGQRVPVAARGFDVGSRLLAEDEVAGLEEQPREEPFAAALVPLDPLADGVVGPACPQAGRGAGRRTTSARRASRRPEVCRELPGP